MSQKLKDETKPYGPANIGDLEVTLIEDTCIGATACVAMAAHTWAINNQGKAVILDTAEQDSESAIIDSARVCPVAAIKIKRISTGEQIV
jgi:ferredoxin